MRALTWQGNLNVRVTDVPDPRIQEPNDAIIAVTSTAICGSDLHLYGVLGPYLSPGDVLGHETMGVVTEVGADITNLVPGDRVVIPFNISCGHCWMCGRGLYAQCETTQVREQGKGAALFGYTSLYGSVPGGQAQFLRVPQAQFGPVKVPADGPDEQYLFLSDVLPTAYQAVAYADTPKDGTLAVLGLGPIGQFSARIAKHLGVERVIGVDGGEVGPMPMMEMFDRGIQLRMGQAHVRRWIDDVMPMVADSSDPLGVQAFATHHLSLEQAPRGYEIFRDKAEGCIKVVLQP